MVVLGKHSFIFESSGRTCNVQPFARELGIASNVPIVDGAIAYDCPFTGDTSILLVRNALYIPSMVNNLIPPFIMRAGGVTVNDVPKIHCPDPSTDDHCLIFKDSDLRIPLQLTGVFSYFHSRMPHTDELHNCNKLFITPDASDWNPHCSSFAKNERAMTNYEGELNVPQRRSNLPMEVPNMSDEIFEMATLSTDAWDRHIDSTVSSAFMADEPDDVGLGNQSEGRDFADALALRGEISKVSASIGSTSISDDDCPIFAQPITTTIEKLEESLADVLAPDHMEEVIAAVSSAQASRSQGVDGKHLSKLWMISEKLGDGAAERNTQLCRHNADNHLSRNFSTNDRMLRYRRIQCAFYTDTMHANPRAVSLRQNKCCQVFVSDKGFVAVYPMKSQSEFQTALHWFCKQVGVPVDLVVDGFSAQTSKDVKRFCDQVGTTLRVLERGTPWANRAELYIGILKEAVRKDMSAMNTPIVLWDYAIKRRALIHNAVPRPLFQAQGLTPHECTFGVPADISNICNFGWYEWIYYRDHGSFPEMKEKLGRCLGPLRNDGNKMAQAVLTSKGTVVSHRTIRKLSRAELHLESEKRKRTIFDDLISKKYGDTINAPPVRKN